MKRGSFTGGLFLTLIFLLIVTQISFPASAIKVPVSFAGGSGTENDPYLIETKEQLNNVREDVKAHYSLIADIEFVASDYAEGGCLYDVNGRGWIAIGSSTKPFTGTFNGNNHTISGLRGSTGLFAFNKGTIIDTHVVDCNFNSSSIYNTYAGGIAARNWGKIEHCSASGSVSAYVAEGASMSTTVAAGGIVGINFTYGSVRRSFSSCTVTSNDSAGGIVGDKDGGTISNCFNTGTVTADNAGGIVGTGWYPDHCYNIGTVVSTSWFEAGGILGEFPGSHHGGPSGSDCYYIDGTLHGVGRSDGYDLTVKLTAEEMKNSVNFPEFDFATIWEMSNDPNYPYPVLRKCVHQLSKIEAVQSTCTDRGNIEYWHCTLCGVNFDAPNNGNQITEVLLPIDVNAHNYGGWSSTGKDTHSRVCANNSAHVETKACSGGTATCVDKAVCSVCNKEYGNVNNDHSLTTTYDSTTQDADAHWQKCTRIGCSYKTTRISHTPGPEASETESQCCMVCGYVIKTALGHTHNYATSWTTDEHGHWHACSGCNEKGDYAVHAWSISEVTKAATCKEEGVKTYTCTGCNATKREAIAKTNKHTYDNACDTTCNVCGITRTVSHRYKSSWSSDKTNHWYECSVCGNKKDAAAHNPGSEATQDTAQTCTICGYIITPALNHTCSYVTDWTTDEHGHWHACSGCNEKGDYAVHAWNNGEVTKEATENETGIKTYTCTVCAATKTEKIPTMTPEVPEPTPTESKPAEPIPPTAPVPTDTQPTAPTPTDSKTDKDAILWIVIAVVAVISAIGGAVAAILIIKKKKNA